MKRSGIFKNLIVDFVILFVLKLKSSDPYWRIFKSFLCEKLFKVGLKTPISLRGSALRSK